MGALEHFKARCAASHHEGSIRFSNSVNRVLQRDFECKKSSNILLNRGGKNLSDGELVSTLNTFFTSVNADIPSLAIASLPAYLPSHQVCKKLLSLNTSKTCGPDRTPARLVNEFAFELAEPLTFIFNESLTSGIVPAIWKDSYITPIPKIPLPESKGDIRPISLTSILSKILEDFIS